jgi:predicted XRE-type DNA-binding protein
MLSANNNANKPSHITTGSVFDDLGLTHAEATEVKVKADLWRELVSHITPLKLTQRELARRLEVHQPEVSNLLTGKLSKFSAGTLILYAVKLGLDVQVKITTPAQTKQCAVKDMMAGSKSRGRNKASTHVPADVV